MRTPRVHPARESADIVAAGKRMSPRLTRVRCVPPRADSKLSPPRWRVSNASGARDERASELEGTHGAGVGGAPRRADASNAAATRDGLSLPCIGLRLDGTFADPVVEADFRERVMRAKLPRRALVICVAIGAIHVMQTGTLAHAHGWDDVGTLVSCAAAALFWAMALFSLCAAKFVFSHAATEAVLAAGLCAHAACMPVVLALIDLHHARTGGEPLWRGLELVVLTGVGLFAPLRLTVYALVAACALGGAAGAICVGNAPSGDTTVEAVGLTYFALVAASLVAGHARLARLERNHFHLTATVTRALAEQGAHREAEVAAELQLQTARVASSARSRLIRMVMHDLRSPLLSIRALSDSLRDDASDSDAAPLNAPHVLEALEGLSTCASLMEYVVSDMLDFERIDSGRLNLVHAPFALSRLLRSVSDTFGAVAAEKQIRLEVAEPEGELGGCWLVGDMRRLQQCLNNGISNALKFTDAGGSVRVFACESPTRAAAAAAGAAPTTAPMATPERAGQGEESERTPRSTAVVTAKRADASTLSGESPSSVVHPRFTRSLGRPVHICVVDSGVGLDAHELHTLQSVREPFEQVGKGQMQGSGGTGLGLHICRQLLQLHHGSQLRLHSEGHGCGTTFELVLCLPRGAPMSAKSSALSFVSSRASSVGAGDSSLRRSAGRSRTMDAASLSDPDSVADALSARMRGRFDSARRSTEFGRGSPSPPLSASGAGSSRESCTPLALPAAAALWAVQEPGGTAGAPMTEDDGGIEHMPPLPSALAAAAPVHAAYLGESAGVAVAVSQPSAEANGSGAPGLIAASDSTASGARTPAAAPPRTPQRLRFAPGFRCLYVDDDKILQRSLPLRTFRKVGAEYDIASDGVEAVSMVERGDVQYAMIVMDNQMPRMTGTAATRALRLGGYTGVIIGMTGDPIGSPDRDEFDAAGLDVCHNKDSAGIAHVLEVLRSFARELGDDDE